MNNLKTTLLALILSMLTFISYSKNQSSVEMADALRSSGKIYVVIGVVLIILFGILFYLLMLDRKISKLEKEIYKD